MSFQIVLVLYKVPVTVQRLTVSFTNMHVLQESLCLPPATFCNQRKNKRKKKRERKWFKKSIDMRFQCLLFMVENNVKYFFLES